MPFPKSRPVTAGGVLPGAFLTFDAGRDSDDIGGDEVTITDAFSSAPYEISVDTPAGRRWLVTLTCKSWHWHSSAAEGPTSPVVEILIGGTASGGVATYPQFQSPLISSDAPTTLQFASFTLAWIVEAAYDGALDFRARGVNIGAGVSAFNLEGPILLAATDAGPS